MNASPLSCPDCGAPLPAGSPQALCPACLMRQALASRTVMAGGGASHSPPPSPEEIADKFPQFEILECLGRGGMGVVYKARQKSLNRLVAIKILAPEREDESRFAGRFAREAELLAKLNHPHIVTIHDFGETGGLFYLVMEFVDGVNLRDLLRDGKLEPKQALAIVPPICEALQFAHDKGIVHRDIKPENLLLDRDGRIKIADFGIAALMGADGEDTGTPPYMAPEQAGAAEVDHRADIYALGVVLYEMLTGERPERDLVAPSKKVRIDVRLDEMVLRALEKSPELRFQTADSLRTAVETISQPTAEPAESQKRKKRRKKVVFRLPDPLPSRPAMLGIAAACVFLGSFVIWFGLAAWRYVADRQEHVFASTVIDADSSWGVNPVLFAIVGLGILFLVAALVVSFVLILKGSGSGPGKGIAIGCLALVFGGVLLALVVLGLILIRTRNMPGRHPGWEMTPSGPGGLFLR